MLVPDYAYLVGYDKQNNFYSRCNRMPLKGFKQESEIIEFK